MKTELQIMKEAQYAAIKVEFLATKEELNLYTGAIFHAMKWGRSIDEKNKAIRRMDNSVK